MNLRRSLTSQSNRIRVGITFGDPSGIGPQIISKAINNPLVTRRADYFIIGDRWVFDKVNSRDFPQSQFIDLNNVSHNNFSFGKIKAAYGKAAIEYINTAVDLIKKKELDCLVTAPISKEAINLAGCKFSGHTEYLAHLTKTTKTVMMLANKYLRTSLVTRHIPISKVSDELSKDKLDRTILLTYYALKGWFNIKEPHIVVCGLNPHASDGGLIGNEENKIIRPVINRLKRKIKYLSGPFPSDSILSKAKGSFYDAAIVIYHDQALIPLKMLDFDSGVNITLGLPFVRTSPLHGTAFDLAGSSKLKSANPNSLICAIQTAINCAINSKRN